MRFFQFFDLPVRFVLDEADLRKRYLSNSKKYHPDFYTLESDAKQAEILQLSSLNNEAYRTLSDFDQRMKYILEEKGLLVEGQNEIPKNFLLEMMDINEQLMELEFDFDQAVFETVKQGVESAEKELLDEVEGLIQGYSEEKSSAEELNQIKNFYLKKRYLLRIKENLSTFAHRS
ncbi:MAG: iron-sulfur cluster co-chaperone HscB C-terminal domain-containing protein [Haliscomenobacter sp.]|uniref:iron-sulfur cluster co-chaperone HscB C-terminal domain-containing protein n=1 Tax=Haliscomenobacter sp. TaxID=2717303 RepID=UPI0029AE0856|nr:iron-sulfur cluster co-chaperone HscB C-terminal domain-containing protein [Haliscomenobacter sp.]MDX2068780.1 iron-sulfur cluster co-chaperone HscB C-terminal domain-containing protein [Haliscomenobacter sp.]